MIYVDFKVGEMLFLTRRVANMQKWKLYASRKQIHDIFCL